MSTFEFNPFTGQFDVAGSGGGTPGGSNTQVQFNDGGAFGGDSGLTFNKTTKAVTVGGATVTTNAPVLDMSQTWNNAGVTFTGLKFNVTDTASNANSLLMDLQVGGVSQFSVNKSGSMLSRGCFVTGVSGSGTTLWMGLSGIGGFGYSIANTIDLNAAGARRARISANGVQTFTNFYWSSADTLSTVDLAITRDAANTLAQRNGANAQESRVYGSYTSGTNFQRLGIKTVRESSGALSGATYTTTIAIPAYAHLIGVTTRVTTAVTGATSYDVGDGTDVDLWGATIGAAEGSDSDTSNFTAVGAVGAAATSRTITLTANGGNFTGGVVEICAHYIFTEAD